MKAEIIISVHIERVKQKRKEDKERCVVVEWGIEGTTSRRDFSA
jgi:hypothetical protein